MVYDNGYISGKFWYLTMDPQVVLDLYGRGFYLIIILVTALMVPGLVAGLVVSVFQAATQINEQTLSFLPKFIITLGVIMYLGPWILMQLTDFTIQLFTDIPMIIG